MTANACIIGHQSIAAYRTARENGTAPLAADESAADEQWAALVDGFDRITDAARREAIADQRRIDRAAKLPQEAV